MNKQNNTWILHISQWTGCLTRSDCENTLTKIYTNALWIVINAFYFFSLSVSEENKNALIISLAKIQKWKWKRIVQLCGTKIGFRIQNEYYIILIYELQFMYMIINKINKCKRICRLFRIIVHLIWN